MVFFSFLGVLPSFNRLIWVFLGFLSVFLGQHVPPSLAHLFFSGRVVQSADFSRPLCPLFFSYFSSSRPRSSVKHAPKRRAIDGDQFLCIVDPAIPVRSLLFSHARNVLPALWYYSFSFCSLSLACWTEHFFDIDSSSLFFSRFLFFQQPGSPFTSGKRLPFNKLLF